MTIKAPAFKKDAVPSLKGWHHPKTNELLMCSRHTQDQVDEFHKELEPVCEYCDEDGNCTCDDIPDDIGHMSKKELELFARENLDVELDRRKGKKTLLDQVINIMKR